MNPSSEDLARTHAAAFQDQRPWTAQEFTALRAGAGVILCGDADSFILGRILAGEAEILTLATAPHMRRAGLAQQCLHTFLDLARAQGATQAFLEVSDANISAKSLYFKAKFHETGRRTGYYSSADGQKSDALLLTRTL